MNKPFNNIVGNGLVASVFRKINRIDNDTVIFASGVSSSQETKEDNFKREIDLLYSIPPKKIVYFSSCFLNEVNSIKTPYQNHKLEMEFHVLKINPNSLIVRIPQIVGGGGNSSNLTNYIYNSIKCNNEILIQENAVRNIIDIEDIAKFVIMLLDMNVKNIVNIASPHSLLVLDIVKIFEVVLNRHVFYKIVPGGTIQSNDLSHIRKYIKSYDNYFEENYNVELIRKYYGKY